MNLKRNLKETVRVYWDGECVGEITFAFDCDLPDTLTFHSTFTKWSVSIQLALTKLKSELNTTFKEVGFTRQITFAENCDLKMLKFWKLLGFTMYNEINYAGKLISCGYGEI